MASIEDLNDEITRIQARIDTLKAQRANITSILLSASHLATRLQQRPVRNESPRRNAANTIRQQSTRNLENIYRACAGVTAYKVKDPDPNAVDHGNLLGVRIEVLVEGRFMDTYHVLFNRPSSRQKSMLRIHRHTIPPCIPLRQLANRYLPQSQKDASVQVEQDLVRFGKLLRKELVSWHLRTAAVESLRSDAGLLEPKPERRTENDEPSFGKILNAFMSEEEDEEEDSDLEEGSRSRQSGPARIIEVETDLAVRQISLAWSDGQTAVAEITKDGDIVKGAVRTRDGERIPALERLLFGRMEGLIKRLTS